MVSQSTIVLVCWTLVILLHCSQGYAIAGRNEDKNEQEDISNSPQYSRQQHSGSYLRESYDDGNYQYAGNPKPIQEHFPQLHMEETVQIPRIEQKRFVKYAPIYKRDTNTVENVNADESPDKTTESTSNVEPAADSTVIDNDDDDTDCADCDEIQQDKMIFTERELDIYLRKLVLQNPSCCPKNILREEDINNIKHFRTDITTNSFLLKSLYEYVKNKTNIFNVNGTTYYSDEDFENSQNKTMVIVNTMSDYFIRMKSFLTTNEAKKLVKREDVTSTVNRDDQINNVGESSKDANTAETKNNDNQNITSSNNEIVLFLRKLILQNQSLFDEELFKDSSEELYDTSISTTENRKFTAIRNTNTEYIEINPILLKTVFTHIRNRTIPDNANSSSYFPEEVFDQSNNKTLVIVGLLSDFFTRILNASGSWRNLENITETEESTTNGDPIVLTTEGNVTS